MKKLAHIKGSDEDHVFWGYCRDGMYLGLVVDTSTTASDHRKEMTVRRLRSLDASRLKPFGCQLTSGSGANQTV